MFVGAPPITVRLGDSGDTVDIQLQEGGRFQLDGEPLVSGAVRLAPNGNRYRFLLRADGSWTTEFVPGRSRLLSYSARAVKPCLSASRKTGAPCCTANRS